MIPSTTYFEYIDHFEKVTDEDSAHSAREITKSEGLFVGYTSGAALQAIRQLNQQNQFFDTQSVVVVVFCDHGSRYMSKIYSDQWMKEQGFFDANHLQYEKATEYIT